MDDLRVLENIELPCPKPKLNFQTPSSKHRMPLHTSTLTVTVCMQGTRQHPLTDTHTPYFCLTNTVLTLVTPFLDPVHSHKPETLNIPQARSAKPYA